MVEGGSWKFAMTYAANVRQAHQILKPPFPGPRESIQDISLDVQCSCHASIQAIKTWWLGPRPSCNLHAHPSRINKLQQMTKIPWHAPH